MKLSCILFDLDGTLVDTAPDLIASLNHALKQHGYEMVQPSHVKPHVSFGASAMINGCMKNVLDDQTHHAILENMLTQYENNIALHSSFFEGILEVLDFIEKQNLSWGIVTNKRERFTHPLVKALELENRAACVICGDTTAHSKPHPAPLFEACKRAQVLPQNCVYIGDAAHDIVAGNNAQMYTLAATYGYLQPSDMPEKWGANALIHSPKDLLAWLKNVL